MEPDEDDAANAEAAASRIDQRRRMIQLLAGTYLLYLAYQLISDAVRRSGVVRR